MSKPSCSSRGKKFYVAVVGGDKFDSHASPHLSSALRNTQADDGDKVVVYEVCARDAGAARLPSTYKKGKRVGKFVAGDDGFSVDG